MLSIKYAYRFSVVVIVVAFTLAACNIPLNGPPRIDLIQTGDQTIIDIEKVAQDNCGGSANLLQVKKRTVSIAIEGLASIGIEYKIVEGQIMVRYSEIVVQEVYQEIIAAPRTRMEFTLEWKLRTLTGAVTSPDRSGEGSYALKTPLAVNVKAVDLGCPGVPTAAAIQPTPNTATVVPVPPAASQCRQTKSQGGLPISGTTYQMLVTQNELHIWTAGNVCVNNDCIQGGRERGNVIILESNNSQQYFLSNLTIANNWHGIYTDCSQQERGKIIEKQFANMRNLPNCPDVGGCKDVKIFSFVDGLRQ